MVIHQSLKCKNGGWRRRSSAATTKDLKILWSNQFCHYYLQKCHFATQN